MFRTQKYITKVDIKSKLSRIDKVTKDIDTPIQRYKSSVGFQQREKVAP